jgi:predicted DNA-binding protein
MKQPIGFRLTPEAIDLIKELAKQLGVSQAAIVEMAIRKFAQEKA